MTGMQSDTRRFWHNTNLDLRLMQAYHIDYAYPPHAHDGYVVCLVEYGIQSFTLKGSKYYTPPSGLILINPDMVHTGEAASEHGFQMRSLYPSLQHMGQVLEGITGQAGQLPYFRDVRIDDREATGRVYRSHQMMTEIDIDPLTVEISFFETLAFLIERYAEKRPAQALFGNERRAVQIVKRYIEQHYAEQISLDDLAAHVALSPYHLLRVFRRDVGMPPHAYLQDVRIRRAMGLIESGTPLAEVAFAVGFSSQSHMTRRFKQVTGVTPGFYRGALRA